jgi:hypothetical protein
LLEGQLDHELCSLAGAIAVGRRLATVHSHEAAHQRQPQTQAAAAAIERRLGLRERLEEPAFRHRQGFALSSCGFVPSTDGARGH